MSLPRALAGIGAPVSFVGAWAIAGARTPGYSPVRDHVSDLAAIGAPTRPLMTAGLLGFAVLAPVFATRLPTGPRAALLVAGAGTLGVAAAPLGASWGDGPHIASAAVSYVGMAALPALGARWSGVPRTSWATSAVSAALLIGSTLGRADGLLQRTGLGVVDAWIAAMAVRALRP